MYSENLHNLFWRFTEDIVCVDYMFHPSGFQVLEIADTTVGGQHRPAQMSTADGPDPPQDGYHRDLSSRTALRLPPCPHRLSALILTGQVVPKH